MNIIMAGRKVMLVPVTDKGIICQECHNHEAVWRVVELTGGIWYWCGNCNLGG